MILDLKGDFYLLKCRTNEGLHVWLPNYHDSFCLPLCQSLLSSQVSFTLWERITNSLLIILILTYMLSEVHPWHGDKLILLTLILIP